VKIVKWVSIPVLLIASLFACCAASYEPLVDWVVCLGAIVFIQRAIRLQEYFWGAGFVAIAIVFTPLSLVMKIFLLMGFICIATFANLLAAFRTQPARVSRVAGVLLILALILAMPVAGIAQTAVTAAPDPLDWQGKLEFHAQNAYGPLASAGIAAYAGFLQEINSPPEWGQGASAYGERVASTAAWAGIHGVLACGLDSTLHEDPRYYRSGGAGLWRRSAHALRGTLLTRTDAGGETVSVWRIGSAYGAAYLSNLWYPARLDTAREGFVDGSVTLGFGLATNLASEFWPDLRRKLRGK
jgi:hypothetical protein